MRKFALLLCALACAAGAYLLRGGTEGAPPAPTQADNPAPRAQTVRVEAARVLSAQAQEEPIVLTVWDEGRAVRMDMEDYLIYAVAGEMPASYEMEALKAQAVAARSYLAWKMPAFGGGGCSQGVDTDVCTDSAHCMAYWSEAEMRERWGEAYAENRARIEEAVKKVFDLRPTAIIKELGLRRPIYRQLAAYGHMGREDLGVKWENTDRVDALKAAVAE